jgi:hypothetical protein
MTIQINGVDSDFSLEDAIAYEFFMDNVRSCLENEEQTGGEVAEAIVEMAKASYLIAEIFSSAREAHKARHIEDTNDQG